MSTELNERTFILIKPDGVQRGIVGRIVSCFEQKGLRIVGLKMVRISDEQARRQYACHEGKPFHESLVAFMTSGPAVAIILEGREAVAIARKVMGETNPLESSPGTIRGDFAVDFKHNLVHGSDSQDSYEYEMPIYFSPEELHDYELALKSWLYHF